MSSSALHDATEATDPVDPLGPLKNLGVRVAWIPNLGDPAAYIPEYRVMLLDAGLSRVEVFAYVRRWVMAQVQA